MFEFLNSLNALDPAANSPVTDIGSFFGVLLNIAIGSAIAIAIITTGIAGIQYMSSTGDVKATDKAKTSLKYSIYALILAMGVLAIRFAITNAIGGTGELLNATPSF